MIDLEKLTQSMGELDEDIVMELLEEFIAQSPDSAATQKVVVACQKGMEIVGDSYEKGEYFVGDLIFAGELLTASIDKLKPLLSSGTVQSRGTIVLGTVEGDIHDIGKNIFKSMAEAAGFTVIDLGIDTPPASFVQAVREHSPEILGLSGVLTVAIESMRQTVEELKSAGLRDNVHITIGGVVASDAVCKQVGANAWSKNAAETVRVCSEWTQGAN